MRIGDEKLTCHPMMTREDHRADGRTASWMGKESARGRGRTKSQSNRIGKLVIVSVVKCVLNRADQLNFNRSCHYQMVFGVDLSWSSRIATERTEKRPSAHHTSQPVPSGGGAMGRKKSIVILSTHQREYVSQEWRFICFMFGINFYGIDRRGWGSLKSDSSAFYRHHRVSFGLKFIDC